MNDLPVVRYLAVLDAPDDDALGGPDFTGGLDALEYTGVPTAAGEAGDHKVAFGHLLFDHGAPVSTATICWTGEQIIR